MHQRPNARPQRSDCAAGGRPEKVTGGLKLLTHERCGGDLRRMAGSIPARGRRLAVGS